MRRFGSIVLVIALFTAFGRCQDKAKDSSARVAGSKESSSAGQGAESIDYEATLRAIKKKRPRISDAALSTDVQTIDEALPAIEANLNQVGIDGGVSPGLVLAAWRHVRLRSPLQPGKPMDSDSFVAFVTTYVALKAIKEDDPNIPTRVLILDTKTIEEALPFIEVKFEGVGSNRQQAISASVAAWIDARANSPLQAEPNKTIDKASLISHATTSMGMVTFRSDPPGAEVYLEGKKIGSTEFSRWYRIGSIKVLFKQGDLEEERDCEVSAPAKECKGYLKRRP